MELFRANNLSRLKPEFVSVRDPELQAQIITSLNDCYSLPEVSQLRLGRAAGANVSSQNLLVELPDARYFLKRRPLTDFECLEREANWAVNLHRLGIKVPRVIPTKSDAKIGSDEQVCFVLYSFEEGDYFSGRDRELDEAASTFTSLTAATIRLSGQLDGPLDRSSFFEELPILLVEAMARRDSSSGNLCQTHEPIIRETLQKVADHRLSIESQTLPMHMDYHPLNLLMKDSKVVCILDFEHVKSYPVSAGLGFAGYKLIRQAMVIDEIREQEFLRPSLLGRWLQEWQREFPGNSFTPIQIGLGARYRVLHLISFILQSWLKQNDERFNYDLEKQLCSLYELDLLTKGY